MRTIFGRLFAFIGFTITVFGLIGGAVYFYFFTDFSEESLDRPMILRYDLERVVEDSSNDNPFQYLGRGHPLSLRTFVESLERASDDPKVIGLVVRVGDASLALAHAEEMRTSISNFKDKGKFFAFFTDSFGEDGDASSLYYLASMASQIWMQPSGTLNLLGLGGEIPFIKKFLNMFGVAAEFGQRYEFKTAPNMFLYEKMPEKQRESEVALMGAMQRQIDDDISKQLSVNPYLFTEIRSKRPLNAQEALDQKLITHIGYWSDFKDKIRDDHPEIGWVKFNRYVSSLKPVEKTAKKIALVVVDGDIIRGETPPLDFRGSSSVGGNTVAKALREAVKDEEVAAIVLRIDSPGGSYIGSDTMWDETVRARDVGVPVVASLGSVAASGGYFLAMAADKIVANASTIVGSIGVYSGKYVLEDIAKKYGINFEQIKTGENATMTSMFKKFTPKQWEILNFQLDSIYDDFVEKFKTCRDYPADAVDGVARGRVFAGRDGLKYRLVDQIGGYLTAIQEAKKLANIPIDQQVAVEIFPRPKSITERVIQYFEDIDDVAQFVKISKNMILEGKRVLSGTMSQTKYEPTVVP